MRVSEGGKRPGMICDVAQQTVPPSGRDLAALLQDPDVATVTGSWTRIEVSGALVQAARGGRADAKGLLGLLDADLALDAPVIVLSAAQERVEDWRSRWRSNWCESTRCVRWLPGTSRPQR